MGSHVKNVSDTRYFHFYSKDLIQQRTFICIAKHKRCPNRQLFLSACLVPSSLYRHSSSLSPLSNCQNTASIFHSLGFHSSSHAQYFRNMTSNCPHNFLHLPGCWMSNFLLVTYFWGVCWFISRPYVKSLFSFRINEVDLYRAK